MTVLWLVLRVRWRRALAPSIAVAILIGGVGGFVLASAAAARRVESAYGRFAAAIDAPDVGLLPGGFCEPTSGTGCEAPPVGANPEVALATVRELPVVEKALLVNAVIPYVIDSEGRPIFGDEDDVNGCADGEGTVQMVATAAGGPKDQVVPFSLDGELPTPGSAKFTLSRATADRVGLQIGDQVQLAGWCDGSGDPIELPAPITLTLSGVSIGPLDVEAPGTGLTIHPSYVDPEVLEAIVAAGLKQESNLMVWLDPNASRASVDESWLRTDRRERLLVRPRVAHVSSNHGSKHKQATDRANRSEQPQQVGIGLQCVLEHNFSIAKVDDGQIGSQRLIHVRPRRVGIQPHDQVRLWFQAGGDHRFEHLWVDVRRVNGVPRFGRFHVERADRYPTLGQRDRREKLNWVAAAVAPTC